MYPGGVRAASFCSGGAGTKTAPPTQNCPHSLRPQSQSHLWPSVLRAGPDGWPSTLQPRPGAAHSRPEVRTARPPRPNTNRARQMGFASFGSVMKDAPGFQPQEDVIYRAAKTAPAPARRTPGAGGSKDNTVLWPETLSRLARITAWLIPGPHKSAAVLAPVAPASFTPAPHSAGLISYARAERQ
jgi:hypothetical protein